MYTHTHTQTSLKLVMDSPAGLKANLVSVMSALPRDIMAKVGATSMPDPENPEDPNEQGLSTFSTDKGARLCGVMAKVGATAMPDPLTIPTIKGLASFLQTKVRDFMALWPKWGPLQCQTLRRSQRLKARHLFYRQRCAASWHYGQIGGHCNARPSDDPNDQRLGTFSTDKGARLRGIMAKLGATAMPDPLTIPTIKGSTPFLQAKVCCCSRLFECEKEGPRRLVTGGSANFICAACEHN